ncbi:hypothetical protein [Nocardia sp. NBC_01327]|uniref:hypothetical protein n=1 Tax=Nocardia sp. NBC_01327 TaxID=2903593 RepID=UPI002E12DF77|nr:hypothetical protein OG326_42155 [Nocardia sp. NBC_01327]
MRIGYGRVSARDQHPEAQLDLWFHATPRSMKAGPEIPSANGFRRFCPTAPFGFHRDTSRHTVSTVVLRSVGVKTLPEKDSDSFK